jgi:hypothetical protein
VEFLFRRAASRSVGNNTQVSKAYPSEGLFRCEFYTFEKIDNAEVEVN